MEFGSGNIYAIRNRQSANRTRPDNVAIQHGGQSLFEESLTRDELCRLLAAGAKMKTTPLTGGFSYEDYLQQNQKQRIPSFAIDPAKRTYPVTAGRLIRFAHSDKNASREPTEKAVGISDARSPAPRRPVAREKANLDSWSRLPGK